MAMHKYSKDIINSLKEMDYDIYVLSDFNIHEIGSIAINELTSTTEKIGRLA